MIFRLQCQRAWSLTSVVVSMAINPKDWNGLQLAEDRYQVTGKLGEGGMAYVYRAHDRHLNADVVIKVPRLAMLDEPKFITRFKQEIQSLVRLSHPHIVRVHDVGVHGGIPFAVLQYLGGGSLDDHREVGPHGEYRPATIESIGDVSLVKDGDGYGYGTSVQFCNSVIVPDGLFVYNKHSSTLRKRSKLSS